MWRLSRGRNFDKQDITMCCKDGRYKNETAPNRRRITNPTVTRPQDLHDPDICTTYTFLMVTISYIQAGVRLISSNHTEVPTQSVAETLSTPGPERVARPGICAVVVA